jgi:hypothetical protein
VDGTTPGLNDLQCHGTAMSEEVLLPMDPPSPVKFSTARKKPRKPRSKKAVKEMQAGQSVGELKARRPPKPRATNVMKVLPLLAEDNFELHTPILKRKRRSTSKKTIVDVFDDLPLNQQTPMPRNDNSNDIGPPPTEGRTFSQGEVYLSMVRVLCALYYVFQNVDVLKGSLVSPNTSAVLCRYSTQAK